MILFASPFRPAPFRLARALVLPLLMLPGTNLLAAPGAHGPNGEHLDAPAQGMAVGGGSASRLEATSETFELVAVLRDNELSMLINRFETSEPVLDAQVEVESGNLRAAARFHADLGDYAVDDAAFVKALQAPGDHALVVTVLAGADTDLLDGTLHASGSTGNPGATADGRGHDHADANGHGISLKAWISGVALAAAALAIWLLGRPSRKSTGIAS